MKRIKTASDLKLFLEAVAKESTLKAKSMLSEDLEQEIEYVSRGLESAKKNQSGYSRYMQIFEVEEEEEAEQDVKEPKEKEADTQPEEDLSSKMGADAAKEKPKNKAVITIPLVEEEPSFEEIKKAIGWMRAGPSIKGETQAELEKYLEKLDDAERKALYTMLSSMANILHKEIPGEKGQDPEDPPLNLIIDDPEDIEKQDSDISTSPDDAPIKVGKQVGGAQSLNEMRRIVRKLMER